MKNKQRIGKMRTGVGATMEGELWSIFGAKY